jgi:hypothetical protein
MKRTLFTIASLLLGAATASAAGINLGWNDCPGGSSYVLTERFACNTNEGVHTLIGSFVAPPGVEKMSANEVQIDLASKPPAPLPDWWKMRSTFCRAASLVGDFDFTTGPFTCYDYWQGGAIGAVVVEFPNAANGRARIKGVFALPAGDARITSIPEGTHVYSFKAVINNAKSAGLGSCAGCNEEACIVLQYIKLNQPPPQSTIWIANPASSQHVYWQGWTTPNPNYQCPQFTPARQQTWGSIKALYR